MRLVFFSKLLGSRTLNCKAIELEPTHQEDVNIYLGDFSPTLLFNTMPHRINKISHILAAMSCVTMNPGYVYLKQGRASSIFTELMELIRYILWEM